MSAEWYQRNKEQVKEYKAQLYHQNKEQKKIYNVEYRQQNKEKIKESKAVYYSDIMSSVVEMLLLRVISDDNIWHLFCNQVRSRAKKYPYSEDFTDDMMFEILKKGCHYCGVIATTIDRTDSNLGHTLDNCVGSCWPCNNSKGNGDVDSFLRKAYFRARGEYFDDDRDIWSDNTGKPRCDKAEIRAMKKGVEFTLPHEQWNSLVLGDCKYCARIRPDGRWNGIDQVIPSGGYTIGNTVPCCDDCNNDKGVFSVEETKARNEKIACRMESKEIVLTRCLKNLRNNGSNTKK